MDFSLTADAISVATSLSGLGFTKCLQPTARNLTISATAHSTGSLSPPTVRSNHCVSAPRTLSRRTHQRIRRRSLTHEPDDDGDYDFIDGSGGDDGPFGGSGSGGGGGWNFDRNGGESNWGDSPSYSDPAFDFVYQVLCWIVLFHCLHFSFKRVVRIIADLSREKVPMRLVQSVC